MNAGCMNVEAVEVHECKMSSMVFNWICFAIPSMFYACMYSNICFCQIHEAYKVWKLFS